MLKDLSILFLNSHQTNTLTLLTTEIWSLRLEMEEALSYGTLTKDQRLSRLSLTTSHGTSRVPEEPIICKSGVLTQDGSRYSFMLMSTSVTLKTKSVLTLQVAKT